MYVILKIHSYYKYKSIDLTWMVIHTQKSIIGQILLSHYTGVNAG